VWDATKAMFPRSRCCWIAAIEYAECDRITVQGRFVEMPVDGQDVVRGRGNRLIDRRDERRWFTAPDAAETPSLIAIVSMYHPVLLTLAASLAQAPAQFDGLARVARAKVTIVVMNPRASAHALPSAKKANDY